MDDWDQNEARHRRKHMVEHTYGLPEEAADVSQMTTQQMMRQYKRKLASLAAQAPASPAKRTRPAHRAAAGQQQVRPLPRTHAPHAAVGRRLPAGGCCGIRSLSGVPWAALAGGLLLLRAR